MSIDKLPVDQPRVASPMGQLRALLLDNTGRVSALAKAQAFAALPSTGRRLDIRI